MDEQVKQELWKMLEKVAARLNLELTHTGARTGKQIIFTPEEIVLSLDGNRDEGIKAAKEIRAFLDVHDILYDYDDSNPNHNVVNNFVFKLL